MAAFAAVHPAVGCWGVATLVTIGLSMRCCLLGLVVRKGYVGPIIPSLVSDPSTEDAEGVLSQVLADLGDATQRHQGPIARKGVYWSCGAVALGLAILFGLTALVTGCEDGGTPMAPDQHNPPRVRTESKTGLRPLPPARPSEKQLTIDKSRGPSKHNKLPTPSKKK